jgi:hypothetical protein
VIRRFALAGLFLLLSACAVFAPRYDPVVGTQTSEAYTLASALLSQIDLGKYPDATSFPAALDSYAAIDARLATAEMRASAEPVSTGIARSARDDLVSFIQGCRAQIRSLADQHRRFGFPVAAGATAPARVSCDQAARAANAMQ